MAHILWFNDAGELIADDDYDCCPVPRQALAVHCRTGRRIHGAVLAIASEHGHDTLAARICPNRGVTLTISGGQPTNLRAL